jgi:1,4-dihydroxy-2-naphthoate octaprenyltransferase
LSPTPLDLKLIWRMTRPGFLIVTAAGCVLGIALAAACGCGISWGRAAATIGLALLAHAAANVLNDFEDGRSGADAANMAGLFPFTGGSRLIQNGVVTLDDTRQVALALFGLVIPAGVLLAVLSGGVVFSIGLAGLFLAWAYSSPPLSLMRRGLGELAVAAAWWLVVLGAYAVQRGTVSVVAAATASSFAGLIANILLINGIPDAAADAQVGKRTLAVRLGPQGSALAYTALASASYALLAVGVAFDLQPPTAIWGLLSAPLSASAAVYLWRHATTPQALRPAIIYTIAAAVLHALAMSVSLALAARAL